MWHSFKCLRISKKEEIQVRQGAGSPQMYRPSFKAYNEESQVVTALLGGILPIKLALLHEWQSIDA